MTTNADIRRPAPPEKPVRGRIKCVVWDLDNTVWDGVLLEDDEVTVRPAVVEQIHRLDALGVLHSVASKNDHDTAMAKLREFGLDEMFLYPRISWNAKSASVEQIAAKLNLGLDAFAFVDDQEFELAEVAYALPEVTCVDVAALEESLARPEFSPRFVTDESAQRRGMYRGQLARDDLETGFVGTNEEFLAGLDMTFTIAPARREDLQRAEELTVRTNQLNSTGRTYSYDELDALRESPDHLLLVASLTDRYGSYGKIGLVLVGTGTPDWRLRMMLMSCRVMSRGVGTVLLGHVMGLARDAGAGLRADFVETGRNRMMQITYAFSGFREVARDGDQVELAADLSQLQAPPGYVTLEVLPA
ncbi:HAD-IIIC family phosphatase [Streptomyces sp. SID4919]|uniref:HAD-IIIC family phosphatase n=1 Tax=unclassified Streptomyces TaxID=2593676 RepID=UPI000823C55D|nr:MULTISPECIES: HAD-IIIC family phosphatase [unclassified Streptomyces]MYY08073.1 HAD-IIIC family phosphatase [Streptomyces sp. SID4919]SCK08634.1 HAD-superfamily phosphatase, subfamily IIIC/FkbH-like domain-containing protein [Streptomyces sp. AmelKG-E11A]